MELNRLNWNKKDGKEFENYLNSLIGNQKEIEFETRIVGTSLPCLGIKTKQVKAIVRELAKGNFVKFINLWLWNNHTETVIIGELISIIKNFDEFKKLLTKYSLCVDNWASCDTLKFKVDKQNENMFLELARDFINNEKPFARRIGLRILFKFLDNEHIKDVFEMVSKLKDEEHYYVNMALSWLMCDAFIKQREKTLEFLKLNKLNDFTLRKTISKCRDSFRVSKEDKELLLSFRP